MHPLNRPFELLNRLMPEMHVENQASANPLDLLSVSAPALLACLLAPRNETRETKRARLFLPLSLKFDQFDAYSPKRLRSEVSPSGMLNFNLPRVTRSYYLSFGIAISEAGGKSKRSARWEIGCPWIADRLTTDKRRDFWIFIKKELEVDYASISGDVENRGEVYVCLLVIRNIIYRVEWIRLWWAGGVRVSWLKFRFSFRNFEKN